MLDLVLILVSAAGSFLLWRSNRSLAGRVEALETAQAGKRLSEIETALAGHTEALAEVTKNLDVTGEQWARIYQNDHAARTRLSERMNTLEANHEALRLSWAERFDATEKSWSEHVDKLADKVTTKLALGAPTKRR